MISGRMWTQNDKDTMRQDLAHVAFFAPLLITIFRTLKSIQLVLWMLYVRTAMLCAGRRSSHQSAAVMEKQSYRFYWILRSRCKIFEQRNHHVPFIFAKMSNYNSALTMVSMEGKVVMRFGHGPMASGPHQFRVSRGVCHHIGPLTPGEGYNSTFAQVYLLETQDQHRGWNGFALAVFL